MTTWLPRCVALLLLALPFVPVVAVAPDNAEIARLVKQLDSDKFKERQAATKRLTEIGEPALDALRKAKDTLEVRRRAEIIIAAIENKLYGEQLRLTGHTGTVCCVSLSADGKRVLTSSEDKTLRLWDADTGQCLRVLRGHTKQIFRAALSPDGKRVLSGSDDGTVRLWDATTGKELLNMTGHASVVRGVAFGPEGKALSGGGDGTMHLWDLNTGKQVGALRGHSNIVRAVLYSTRTKRAATLGDDNLILLWDLETHKVVHKMRGQMCVCFSPDGKCLLSIGIDDGPRWRIWDAETGKELRGLEFFLSYCAAFSPDGQRIVSGHREDNTMYLLDAATGKELRKYQGHTARVVGVAFFPDGKRIVSASEDHTARIWRAPR